MKDTWLLVAALAFVVVAGAGVNLALIDYSPGVFPGPEADVNLAFYNGVGWVISAAGVAGTCLVAAYMSD